ncbi:MAG: hypothetical protein R8N24_02510 [Alphaproteobacteria bacterium]|nr:hypothetical protein [Alphaproteobacteria bacterium]
MIIIAFSDKTSKILPKILCGKIKHCAPISVHNNTLVMHQFVSHNNIVKIKLNMRDIRILQRYGWRFVYLTGDMLNNINTRDIWTCVQLCKRAIGLRNITIQTPSGLYKTIK